MYLNASNNLIKTDNCINYTHLNFTRHGIYQVIGCTELTQNIYIRAAYTVFIKNIITGSF